MSRPNFQQAQPINNDPAAGTVIVTGSNTATQPASPITTDLSLGATNLSDNAICGAIAGNGSTITVFDTQGVLV